MSAWRKHDGGPNPAPGEAVDLIWGIGVIERQPSSRVNWSFKWTWRPSDEHEHHPNQGGGATMTDDQIKHMVNRFLGWKLPADFRPDGGVQFDADAAKKLDPRNLRYEPYGTNLLDATQASLMVRHMIEGLPENEIGAAEVEVGRWVYRRIETLMDAKAGTPEGDELTYLAAVAASVEEYGEEACGGTGLATKGEDIDV